MVTVLESLNAALQRSLAADQRVLLLGEDILDPYGGAFKVTRGLSEAFPGRVWATPISEAGITGLAAGMALRGLRPVVEIMFGDFVTLIADQLINHAAKFRWMYNDQAGVPMVVRTPMGGRRGYGPTHSQTLEKLFLGVPGLCVLAPCSLALDNQDGPGALLENVILHGEQPCLFVENKLLYLLPVQTPSNLPEFEFVPSDTNYADHSPCYTLRLRHAPPPELTIAAYGYMAELARQAILRLAYEYELFAELVIPTQLAPFRIEPVLDSTRRTKRLLAVEEGTKTLGWSAEILARVAEAMSPDLLSTSRLAALDLPVPASPPLEASVLPGVEGILQAGLAALGKRTNTREE